MDNRFNDNKKSIDEQIEELIFSHPYLAVLFIGVFTPAVILIAVYLLTLVIVYPVVS